VAVLGKTIDVTQQLSDDLHANGAPPRRICKQVTDEINSKHRQSGRLHPAPQELFLLGATLFSIFRSVGAFRSLFDGLDGIDSLDVQDRAKTVHRSPGGRRAPAPVGHPVEDPEGRYAGNSRPVGRQHLRPGRILQATQTDQTFDDQINVGNDLRPVAQ